MDLVSLGWNDFFAAHFAPHEAHGWIPARIAVEQRGQYQLYGAAGEMTGQLAGKLRHATQERADLPAVGDWVAVAGDGERGLIQAVLPRRSCFVRRAPISGGRRVRQIGEREIVVGGATEAQVVAANIDTAVFVAGLDGNFNLRRIERFITQVQASGAAPVIVLNKADLPADTNAFTDQVQGVAPQVPVHLISALEERGLEQLSRYLGPGQTAVFIGSSGVGKSTLINALLGHQRQAVKAVSQAVGKGRHTTTYRELIHLPEGGLMVDTPGMREWQIWGDEADLQQSFADVEDVIRECRYADCQHRDKDRGCAVRPALASGALNTERYQSYMQQQSELAYLAQRQRAKEQRTQKKNRRAAPDKGRRQRRSDWR